MSSSSSSSSSQVGANTANDSAESHVLKVLVLGDPATGKVSASNLYVLLVTIIEY